MADVRAEEAALDLSGLPPEEALARLVRFTFDHHAAHPDFIRLVMVANIHEAQHIRRSERIRAINRSAIETLEQLRARGVAAGCFSPDVSALALHWHISALSFFNVSNRPSFTVLFGEEGDTAPPAGLAPQILREQCVLGVLAVARGQAAP